MQFQVYDTYEEMSCAGATMIAALLREQPHCVLGLATGSTPEGLYRELIRMHREEGLSFAQAGSFNLDEYYPLAAEHPQSYHTYMEEHLFRFIDLPAEKTHVPDGMASDPDRFCRDYEAMITEAGGIDLQLLGIGRNGHIGFNEPAEELESMTHVTALTASTREANARFFDHMSQVPDRALTMGVGTILKARRILLVASGADKADVIRMLRKGVITTQVPATLLHLHRSVTILCDKEAYGA